MLTAAAIVGILLVGWIALTRRWKRHVQRRNSLLIDQGYFVGRLIDEAIAALGTCKGTQSGYYQLDDVRYFWESYDDQLSLIADANGVVTDYIPPRQPPDVLRRVFMDECGQALIGTSVRDIIRQAGWPRQRGSWDHGRESMTWQLGARTSVEVWADGEVCTAVEVEE